VATPAADAVFPKAYEEFAATLFGEFKREHPESLARALRRIADAWVARDLPRVEHLTGPARLEQVRQILTERGFLPTLERTDGGYVLREHNCPIMKIAAVHPEVCEMVHQWLEALAGAPLARLRCMRQGDPYSEYVLRARV
jgi:predicted ArsR family transcriptional regulator